MFRCRKIFSFGTMRAVKMRPHTSEVGVSVQAFRTPIYRLTELLTFRRCWYVTVAKLAIGTIGASLQFAGGCEGDGWIVDFAQ